jgi:hypothetical protein
MGLFVFAEAQRLKRLAAVTMRTDKRLDGSQLVGQNG